jgi:DNA invertase Pin-like site-specific DNA recombinase
VIIGYARSSTIDQKAGLAGQIRDLEAAGCDRIFREHVSSVDRDKRHQLALAFEVSRPGDTFVVTKLDRLARSVADFIDLQDQLKAKGVTLKVLSMGLDTGDAASQLMINVLVSVAQFEREIMLERQKEGIARAKAEGKYKGRQPKAMAKRDQVRQLHQDGLGATEIARKLGIGRSSVYRCLS